VAEEMHFIYFLLKKSVLVRSHKKQLKQK